MVRRRQRLAAGDGARSAAGGLLAGAEGDETTRKASCAAAEEERWGRQQVAQLDVGRVGGGQSSAAAGKASGWRREGNDRGGLAGAGVANGETETTASDGKFLVGGGRGVRLICAGPRPRG